MFRTNSPLTILNAQAEALAAHLPAVFAGDVEGVHDARIATRRLRETLPLTPPASGVTSWTICRPG